MLSLRDITLEDKNLGSLRFGLIKKIKFPLGNFNKNENAEKDKNNFMNVFNYNEKKYAFKENCSLNNFYFGFLIDRALYPKNESNTVSSFSSRDYLKFLLGYEKESFSVLYKLKYIRFNKNETIHKGYFQYLLSPNSNLKLNFTYSGKNEKLNYCISSSIKTDPNTNLDIFFDNNKTMKLNISSKLNEKSKINFYADFSFNENNNSTNLKKQFGLGFHYDFENDLFPQIKNKQNDYDFNHADTNSERGFELKDIKNFFLSTYDGIKNLINSVDIY